MWYSLFKLIPNPSEVDWSIWGLPLVAMVTGAAFGYILVGRLGIRDATIAGETRRIDLESTHEDMVDALKLLELDRDKLAAAEYAAERKALLARGARALAALDGVNVEGVEMADPVPPREEPPPTPAAPAGPAPTGSAPTGGGPLAGMSPEWRGALSMLVVVAVLFGLWQWASNQAQVRGDGKGMTGNQSLGGSRQPQQDPGQAFRDSTEYKQGWPTSRPSWPPTRTISRR